MANEETSGASFEAFQVEVGELGGHRTESFTGPADEWTERHRRRLAQTAALPGLLPVIGAQRTNGSARVVQYAPATTSLADQLASDARPSWFEATGIVSAASRGLHAAHLDGLAHGALTADDVRLYGDKIAVAGTGVSLGGSIPASRHPNTAPEVLDGAAATARSDVYSLGKVLEQAIAGQPDVPEAVSSLVTRATSARAADRPVSAWFFAEGLDKASGPRTKRYLLADLGATSEFEAASALYRPPIAGRGAATVIEESGGVGIAGVAGAAAVGAGVAGVAGAAGAELPPTEKIETVSAAASTSAGAAVRRDDDDDNKGAIWPWAAAAIVGVGALGWLATRDGGDDDVDVAGTVQVADADDEVDDEAETTTTTEAETTTTTEAETTTTTEAETTTTTEAEAEESEVEEAVDDGPLDSATAEESFEILHSVPDFDADIYLDGKLLASGVQTGGVLSPIPGSGEVEIFAASDDAPVTTDERDDVAVLSASAPAGGVVVAHVADGAPTITNFDSDLGAVSAGEGRLALRHVAPVGPATITIDGEEVAAGVASGEGLETNVTAGPHDVLVTADDGTVLFQGTVDVPEGELTTAFVGAGDERNAVDVVVRRIQGLDSAPAGVPSGTSGLTDSSAPMALVASLIAAMSAAGATLRRRTTH